MSFTMERTLICSGCKKREFASENNFPDNLHETLIQLNIPHLHWICGSCENNFGLYSSGSKFMTQEFSRKHTENKIKTFEIFLSETEDEKMNSSSSSFDSFDNVKELEERRNFKDKGSPSEVSVDSYKRNKSANTIVNEILKTEVKIDKQQLAKSKEIVTTFITSFLIPFFKKDEIFAEVFQKEYYTGSSYNDLKVSQANEYDVNLILNIPKRNVILKPTFFESTSMFAKLVWKDIGFPSGIVLRILEKFSESENTFDPLKIVSWLQSLMDNFIKSNPEIPGVVKVKPFQTGPARTVQLDTVHGYSICIDFVPVFQFDYSDFKENSVLNSYPVHCSKQFWFLVPKPCRGEQLMFGHEMKSSWRVHLPEAEKAVLYNKQSAKPVIKLLKLLRDKQVWGGYLSSYHCKTVVLWELKSHSDSEYWSEKFLYERFLEALKSLTKYFEEKKLPYFFDEGYNLFHQINGKQAHNMCSRLSRIVKDIEEDPENLKKYFKFNVKSLNT